MSESSLIFILVVFCITIIALNSQSAHLKELSIKALSKLLGGRDDK
jgi:hypothetical protein